jgi:tetratricopeptide (TPR) repeat protein
MAALCELLHGEGLGFLSSEQPMVDCSHEVSTGAPQIVQVAIVAAAGLGKTALAAHYVRAHRAHYPGGIWWVAAARLATEVWEYAARLEWPALPSTRLPAGSSAGSSAGLAAELSNGAPSQLTEAQIVQHYLEHWQEQSGELKLLVVDDVADYAQVQDFLPQQGAFQVLMTTRSHLKDAVQPLVLGRLTAAAALDLLRRWMDKSPPSEPFWENRIVQSPPPLEDLRGRVDAELAAASELCEWVGYSPLGIEWVGIEQTLAQLKASWAAALSGTSPAPLNSPKVQLAIALNWEQLDAEAQQVAMLVSLFAVAPIGLTDIQACLPEMANVANVLDRVLVQRGFLERLSQGYQMSALVQEFVQKQRVADELARRFAQTMTAVAKTLDHPSGGIADRAATLRALPHLAAATKSAALLAPGPDQLCIFIALARFYKGQGGWQQAADWSILGYQFAAKTYGEGHPTTIQRLNSLARLYCAMGRYESALPLFEQALDQSRSERGQIHPDRVSSLNNLAGLYYLMGQPDSALPLFEAALVIRQSGERPLDTAASLNNLAGLHCSAGRYASALPLYEQALHICQSELGVQHPATASSLNNLAGLYYSLGRLESALPLFETALKIRQFRLGTHHPATATSLNNLARLYESLGRYESALPLSAQALKIRQSELGNRHPATATSLNNVARLYAAIGRYESALPLYEEALKNCQSELGNRHPMTAASLNGLAKLYAAMGRYDAVLPLFEEALKISQSELGERHLDTAASLNNLARLYASMGRCEAALPLFEKAWAICQSELGHHHPTTVSSLNNLARLYYSMGRYDAVLPLYEQALNVCLTELGERHPDTAVSLNNLAGLYSAMGQYESALPLFERALAIRQSELGERHPDTVSSLNNLAVLHCYRQQFDRALPLLQDAFSICQQVLPPGHPDIASTQESLKNVQQVLFAQQEYGILQAIPLLEAALGANHPVIEAKRQELARLRADRQSPMASGL